jgi:cytochrome c oxidase subunit 2
MRFKVHVRTPADFDTWVEDQLAPAAVPTEGVAADGFEAFNTCVACHNATVAGPDGVEDIGPVRSIEVDGVTFTSSLAPDLTHFGSRGTFGAGTFENDREHLEQWLANPSDLKPMRPELNNIEEGRILGMPNFNLSDEDIDSLITLLEGWK